MAEKVKKILRDNNGDISEEKKTELVLELGDVLWYISAIARDLNVTLADVAQYNIAKLASRANRNKLQGDGDTR